MRCQYTAFFNFKIIGSEVEVVPDMLITGAFAHINIVMVDWTKQDEKELAKERNELLKKLKVLTL